MKWSTNPSTLAEQIAAYPWYGDPEGAHCDEDSMREVVLEAIAAGHPDPAALAAVALTTPNDMTRWYA